MNSKEKILNALNHKSGPIPFDIGAFPTTGIHVSTMEGLRDYYGLEKRIPKIIEPFQMLGMVEDDLREAVGIDTKPLWNPGTIFGFKNENWKEWITTWGQKVLVPEKFNTTQDKKYVYIYAQGDLSYPPAGRMPKSGYFFDAIVRQIPFDEDNLNTQDNLEEFTILSEEDIEYFKKLNTELENSKYFVVGNLGGTAIGDIALVPGPSLKNPKGIRDIEEWYVSTIARPDYLHELFTKQTDIAIKNLKKLYSILGETIHAVYICGTDFGTQRGIFCSVDTFNNVYAPYYRKINDWVHQNTGWKTFKHSCGGIEPIIEGLIEAGFDILNPVQWTAQGMDMKVIKSKYGKHIVFWGGGVDTQKTLPFGTPEEVRREVLQTCEVFSEGGGFIFNTVHNIQASVPIENIVAMIEAVKEFNKGR